MESTTSNNKRIAKNTAFLYLRMLLTSFLSLYTARLILKVLGVEDFGIYNVVGGVVTFMGFLTASLSSATQRFLAFDLGKNDGNEFGKTFSMLINIYMAFCVIALVVLEIVGPIYINHYMTIPQGRITAAHWVFQFSLASFLVSTFSVPFRSSIVAYEIMGVYAYVGIIESVLQLLIVVGLQYIDYDHLVIYGLFMCILHIGITLSMIMYSKYKLEFCKYQRYWNADRFKELISYSGWNLFGSTTGVMNIQGQAIVLNYFFGPVVNAAKAIADRVNGIISMFAQNFYMAVTPQIIKSYAAGNIDYTRSLVLNSSRYSYFLLFIIALPIYAVMEPLLALWLGQEQVSEEMVKFCQCVLLYACIDILEKPITMAVRATGDIKRYQILVGSLTLTFIPLCIIIFLLGAPAYASVLLLAVVNFIVLFIRIHIVCPIIKTTQREYALAVLLRISLTTIMSLLISLLLLYYIPADGFFWLVRGALVLFVCIIVIFFVGLKIEERKMIIDIVRNRVISKP